LARLSDREQGGLPRVTRLGFIEKFHDLRDARQSRRATLRYVISAMPPEGVLRDVAAARDIAIWQSGPQVGFDIRAFGMPADGASPGHAITLQTPRPDTGESIMAPTQDGVSETRSMLCRLIYIVLPRPSVSIARVHAGQRVADHEAARARWFAFALLDVILELSSEIRQLPVLGYIVQPLQKPDRRTTVAAIPSLCRCTWAMGQFRQKSYGLVRAEFARCRTNEIKRRHGDAFRFTP
jgi:hypothetical protein